MTPEQQFEFDQLTDDAKSRIVHALNDELKDFNLALQHENTVLRRFVYGLRPVVPHERKGWVKCLSCLNAQPKGKFAHLDRCVWHQIQQAVKESAR